MEQLDDEMAGARDREASPSRRAAEAGAEDGPLFVGVAGGSGSGKTTVVERIIHALTPRPVSLIHHDSYYRDLSHLPTEERGRVNFDHPAALETELLAAHLERLRDGEAVGVPVYDFSTHSRLERTRRATPTGIVIVEGILILAERAIREQLDIRIFVDADPDIRLIRRLHRDLRERDRTVESVLHQYEETVRPMHLEFVEPSKRYADIIVPVGGENEVAIEMVVAKLREALEPLASD